MQNSGEETTVVLRGKFITLRAHIKRTKKTENQCIKYPTQNLKMKIERIKDNIKNPHKKYFLKAMREVQ